MKKTEKSHKVSDKEIAKHLIENYDGGSKKALFIETMLRFFSKKVEPDIEIAKINKDEIPYGVYVLGGYTYGKGRKEIGKPHFYYSDNYYTSNKFNVAILIPTIAEWIENKELVINPQDSSHQDWTGLQKEKEILIDWMSQPNVRSPRNSNLFEILNFWNTLNVDNLNVSQVPNKGDDLF